jgi:L-asparaginase
MKQVFVITTGGTIATKQKLLAGGGVVRSPRDSDLLDLLPRDEIDDIEVVFDEFSNVPGSHFMPANGLQLAQRIQSVLLAPDVYGVVVTHGTDTLEETAYLLDLTVNTSKPIVCTGSIRSGPHANQDGLVNLAQAIQLAASPQARDLGVVVVFNDEIHAASEVQHVHTQDRHAFQSPLSGPLGHIENSTIWLHHRSLQRQYIPCSRLEEMVDLIRISQGIDDRMLRHSIDDGVVGVVIEAFGGGRVPPWWLPAISEAISRRVVVALTSRCLSGSLGDNYGYVGAFHDLKRFGVLIVQNLNGCKARIKLMAALGAARNIQELRTWFES